MTTDHDSYKPSGQFTRIYGELYYRISSYDLMLPFLMSIASDTDLWMFISSRGGLTAGRVDADGSLFPYETVDRLHDGHLHTGPVTLICAKRGDGDEVLWEPFTEKSREQFRIERNLYKNTMGNRLVFEEINHDLELEFRYRWSGSDELGIVRTAELNNFGSEEVEIALLDGLRNILPFGAPLALYQQSSSLVDAYKRVDVDKETKLGIFSLTSKIIDRAEAAEVLRANTVWCSGLDTFEVCLSLEAIATFRKCESIEGEDLLTGRRGNYLVSSSIELPAGGSSKWHFAADIGRSHAQIASLRSSLMEGRYTDQRIEESLKGASENLLRNVGSADGIQLTGHPETYVHHFANVLFNNMRGGVFSHNYDIGRADLIDFLQARNMAVANRHGALLESMSDQITLPELLDAASATEDPDLQRLCYEYLPIYFGRRHGDPSRPWNRFSIQVKNPDGSRALRYEGNWRDIFQNWEALCLSFPGFLPNIIAKFVNASTVDGFNPYRITRDGIDWEVADPDDPWSHIGYWGDHQIIYLLKFLEALPRFYPGVLESLFEREIFCYADVPYRIKSYPEILEDPHSTILYDTKFASLIEKRVMNIGTDGKLVHGKDGSICRVNLLEKLLVAALSKLSNLVCDGGIWMNTQRPEWNDANNALAGNGISMVTLCYLRRYLSFLEGLLGSLDNRKTSISTEVLEWFQRLHDILEGNRSLLDSETISDSDRRILLDSLGEAFADYRGNVYSSGFSGKKKLSIDKIAELCRIALEYLDHSIRANRRGNGLYNSYNLLEIAKDEKEASVQSLYEMLEGQVAVLSSGAAGTAETVELLSSLFDSPMYDENRKSFLLYPERDLPGFLERNVIPEEIVQSVPLFAELLGAGDRSIVERDAAGVHRFNGDFENVRDLTSALDNLTEEERWTDWVARDRAAALEAFENVFHHTSFTGRSGTMYGYEGLGCIYWHMVSKLLLAVQEITLKASRAGQPAVDFENLAKTYYRIRAGLGFEKTALEYGAFPTDPYSHTPAFAGAQQPGMTGQVKEEIVTRLGELGVRVQEGIVSFRPVLLRRKEFLAEPGTYYFYDLDGKSRLINVSAGALAFSFCQVPVIYELNQNEAWIRVTTSDGASSTLSGDRLDADHSRELFGRSGGISQIDVGVPEGSLCSI